MKIRLLSDNGYIGMGGVVFPVDVDVEAEVDGGNAYVPRTELYRIGSKPYFNVLSSYRFPLPCWEVVE